MTEKLVNKKLIKQVARKCRICGDKSANVLDVHRIQGANLETDYVNDNRYTESNTCVLCSNCHRKVHDKQIVIHRWHMSTAGRVLYITKDGVDQFV